MKNGSKTQSKPLFTSHIFCKSFLFFCLICIFACSSHSKSEETDYRDGLLLTRNMLDQFDEYPGTTEYLNYLKNRLLQNLPNQALVNYKIVVLNSNQLMAFSPGGGFILISKGLIKHCRVEAELAFVLAHEISHQYLGHTAQINVNPNEINPYTKDYELAADKLAIAILASAGYDPNIAIQALSNVYYHSSITSSDSYPELKERIAAIRSAIKDSDWQPPGTIDRRNYQLFLQSIY